MRLRMCESMPLSHEPRDLARFQTVRAESLVRMLATCAFEERKLRVRGPRTGTIYTVKGITVSDKWIEIRLYSPLTHSERVWKRLPSNGIQVVRRGY